MAGNVTVNQIQLGNSGTATNNFVLRTNADGSATLARGNIGATTQDLVTINSAGIVTLPVNKFVSSEQTITAAGSLTLPHGLGVAPTLFQLFLICKTAELNYSVNDEVPISVSSFTTSVGDNYGVQMTPDATNLNLRFGSRASVFFLNNKTTGAGAAITPASWRLIVKAVAL
jgi:hypothetical protein